jgi:hypothetical protein
MDELLESLDRDSLLKSIRKCIEEAAIDDSLPENRFLLVAVANVRTAASATYEDHAPTGPEIAQKAFERAPLGPPIYHSRPPLDRGAIFNTKTQEILAYRFKAL